MLKEPTHRHKTDKFGNGQRAPYMMMMSHPQLKTKTKRAQTWKMQSTQPRVHRD